MHKHFSFTRRSGGCMNKSGIAVALAVALGAGIALS